MKIGKAPAIIILIVGIMLIASGLSIQTIAANNADFQDASELTKKLIDRELSPQLVGEMLNDGVKAGIFTVTLDDVLVFVDEGERDKITFYANVYALSPTMVYTGIAVTAIGVVFLVIHIIQKRKEKKTDEET